VTFVVENQMVNHSMTEKDCCHSCRNTFRSQQSSYNH